MDQGVRLKDKKHQAILRAAAETFRQHGFDNASMDAIAEAANVSKRTVYNHFASKDLLFAAIVRHLQESPTAMQDIAYDCQRPLSDQLTEVAHKIVHFYSSPEFRCLSRVIVSRLLQAPELTSKLFAGGKLFEAGLTAWFEAARRDGRMINLDAGFVARQFLGLLESFTVWPQLLKEERKPPPAEVERIVRSTVSMILAVYASDSAQPNVGGDDAPPLR